MNKEITQKYSVVESKTAKKGKLDISRFIGVEIGNRRFSRYVGMKQTTEHRYAIPGCGFPSRAVVKTVGLQDLLSTFKGKLTFYE